MANHLGITRGTRESYSPNDLPKAKLKRVVKALDNVAEDVGVKHTQTKSGANKALRSLAVHPDDVLVVQHPTPAEFAQGVRFEFPQKAILTYPARAKTNLLGRGCFYDPDGAPVPKEFVRKPAPRARAVQPAVPDNLDVPHQNVLYRKILTNNEA